MAKAVNKVLLLGRLGKDPEMKGTACKASLAVTDRFKDKQGQWQERTEWVHLVAFGKTAEVMGQYLKKGSQVFVDGKLQTSSWDDKDTGEKKYRTEVVVNDLVFLGGKSESRGEGSGGSDVDQDIPF